MAWGTHGFVGGNVRDTRDYSSIATSMQNGNVPVGGMMRQSTPTPGVTPPPPGGTTPPPPPSNTGAPTSGYVFTPTGTKPWNDPSLASLVWDPASKSYKAGGTTPPVTTTPGGTTPPAPTTPPPTAPTKYTPGATIPDGMMVDNQGNITSRAPMQGESQQAYFARTGFGGYGQTVQQMQQNWQDQLHNPDPAKQINPPSANAPYGSRLDGTPFQSQAEADAYVQASLTRSHNLAKWQDDFTNIVNNYLASPLSQRMQAAAAALGPNAGEKAIDAWMQGGQMDWGLAANMVNQAFNANKLMVGDINNYMAGGGTAYVPADVGALGWTRDPTTGALTPGAGDQSGITWNAATGRFDIPDFEKAVDYYRNVKYNGRWQRASMPGSTPGAPPPPSATGPTPTGQWLGNWWSGH